MKKNLTKAALAAMLAVVPLSAGEYDYNTRSLFAIEGGFTNLNAEVNTVGYSVQKAGMGNVGLKLGAESDNYRVFLSGRYFLADEGNTVATTGGELQYKFNFSKPVNFFIGANAGLAYIKVGTSSDGMLPSASTTTPYYGGDLGFNYHASELIDLEIGTRYMQLDDSITQGSTTYKFNNMVSGYASVIIKWRMD